MEDERKPVQLQEIPDNMKPRYAVLQAALDAGIKQCDIATAFGRTRGAVSIATKKLNRKYDLTSEKYVKLAGHAVKNILEGKTWGTIDKIKDSTALSASQMVYDRAQPIKITDTVNNTNTFVQFNLGAASSPEVVNIPDLIDITPPDTTP
jgi:hypothetical protein